jgi:hypothetical protein
MTARHVDMLLAAGETPNLGVRYHRVGATLELGAVTAGQWVFYQDDAWPVHAVEVVAAGTVRVRLGRGQFWEPDVIARSDTLALEAAPEPIADAFVNYRTNGGTWAPVPFGLAANATELRVLPPDAASATFTTELAAAAEVGGPASYEWEASARFASGGQWVRLAEGALMFVPSIVRA